MAELKTTPNDKSVTEFIETVPDEGKRQDCFELVRMMSELTGSPARMWGSAIVGFGNYHYKYESGREGDWFLTGFSPRKQNLTLYIMSGFQKYDELMSKIGKYKTGKSCLYVKRLSDLDVTVLRQLISESIRFVKERYS